MLQRLQRASEVASIRTLAPGDVPTPDIGDPGRTEVTINQPITYTLKNMASLDSFSWEMLHCCPPVFRHIPEHWRHSFAEAKAAVVTSLLKCSNVVDEAERARSLDRH